MPINDNKNYCRWKCPPFVEVEEVQVVRSDPYIDITLFADEARMLYALVNFGTHNNVFKSIRKKLTDNQYDKVFDIFNKIK